MSLFMEPVVIKTMFTCCVGGVSITRWWIHTVSTIMWPQYTFVCLTERLCLVLFPLSNPSRETVSVCIKSSVITWVHQFHLKKQICTSKMSLNNMQTLKWVFQPWLWGCQEFKCSYLKCVVIDKTNIDKKYFSSNYSFWNYKTPHTILRKLCSIT